MSMDVVDFDPDSWESLLNFTTTRNDSGNKMLAQSSNLCVDDSGNSTSSSSAMLDTNVSKDDDILGQSQSKSENIGEFTNNPEERKDLTNLKYKLRPRSIINRIETEKRKQCKKIPKPKQKPAPLSKYRRKTANARERDRMQEMNQAFEKLRKAVPEIPNKAGSSSKLTKITTLRLAVNYIAALTDILQQTDTGKSTGHSDSGQSLESLESSLEFDCEPCVLPIDYLDFMLDSDGDSMPLSDELTNS
ncbi:uncharacterized protein LOC143226140 [Tachypleus tridentatus]|uniref:uncharacterized protein LOC143226140 n=1 Tax=Tachypleus tridentatus TaxID=6853 RepID=UPI003FD1AB16